ncbi:MAG: VacJ family lipoprotein [Alphaproteobacteria bacterium]|nr:VacJ family lipoprotein [Alphaproteobacteria bacterium]
MFIKLFIKLLVFIVLIYNTSSNIYSSNIDNSLPSKDKSQNKQDNESKNDSTSEENSEENIKDKDSNEDNNTEDKNIDEDDDNDSGETENNSEDDNNDAEENDEDSDTDEDEDIEDDDDEDDNDEEDEDTEEDDNEEEIEEDDDGESEEEDSVYDPFEKFNRKVSDFNDTMNSLLDKVIPSNKDKSKPSTISKGIGNFAHNFFESPRVINYTLQGNIKNASNSIARLMINTLFGFFGVADVAEKLGFEKKNTDFGDTLKKWGMKTGPYVVLPILGPTSLRGVVGQILDLPSSVAKLPLKNMKPLAKNVTYYSIYCCGLLAKRSAYGDMIQQVSSMSKDKYKTFRSIIMSAESN